MDTCLRLGITREGRVRTPLQLMGQATLPSGSPGADLYTSVPDPKEGHKSGINIGDAGGKGTLYQFIYASFFY